MHIKDFALSFTSYVLLHFGHTISINIDSPPIIYLLGFGHSPALY